MPLSCPGIRSFSRICGFNLFSASIPKDLLPKDCKRWATNQPPSINHVLVESWFGSLTEVPRPPDVQQGSDELRPPEELPEREAAAVRAALERWRELRCGGWNSWGNVSSGLDFYIVFSWYPWSLDSFIYWQKIGSHAKFGVSPFSKLVLAPLWLPQQSTTLLGLRPYKVFYCVRIFTGSHQRPGWFKSASLIWQMK